MIPLAIIIAVIFGALGTAKVLAAPPTRGLAAKSGFSTVAYRRIGVLEVAGAVGVALGPVVPLLGVSAAAGLFLLLVGAVAVHVRNRAEVREVVPAVVCIALVACYVTVVLGAMR